MLHAAALARAAEMVLRTALLLLYAAASAAGPDAMAPPTMAPPTMAHTDLMSAGPESPWAGFRIPGFAAVRGHRPSLPSPRPGSTPALTLDTTTS